MTSVRTSTAVAAAPRASYRSVLAVREFRVLFTGLLMYVLGFEFEILGLSVLVYARTGSGLLAAVAFSAGFAPQAVAGALFTSLADRLPPRAAIAGGLLARAAPGLVIGLAPTMPIPLTLTVVAAAALVTPVFLAANSGLLPEVLEGTATPSAAPCLAWSARARRSRGWRSAVCFCRCCPRAGCWFSRMLLGNIVVGRLCPPAVRERLVLPLTIVVGVPLLTFAWRPPLVVAALALFVSGLGFAYTLGLQRAFIDTVPQHLRGQGFGLASTGTMGGQGLLPSALGGVATALGAGGAVAMAGAAVVSGVRC